MTSRFSLRKLNYIPKSYHFFGILIIFFALLQSFLISIILIITLVYSVYNLFISQNEYVSIKLVAYMIAKCLSVQKTVITFYV